MTKPDGNVEFSLAYEQAQDLFKAFPDYQFKTVSAIFIIIGWLLTASTAQAFIAAHASTALPATVVAFSVLILFKFVWIVGHYKRMRTVHGRLVRLAEADGLAAETVDVFKLGPVLPATYLAINVMLCLAVMAIVWMICQ